MVKNNEPIWTEQHTLTEAQADYIIVAISYCFLVAAFFTSLTYFVRGCVRTFHMLRILQRNESKDKKHSEMESANTDSV